MAKWRSQTECSRCGHSVDIDVSLRGGATCYTFTCKAPTPPPAPKEPLSIDNPIEAPVEFSNGVSLEAVLSGEKKVKLTWDTNSLKSDRYARITGLPSGVKLPSIKVSAYNNSVSRTAYKGSIEFTTDQWAGLTIGIQECVISRGACPYYNQGALECDKSTFKWPLVDSCSAHKTTTKVDSGYAFSNFPPAVSFAAPTSPSAVRGQSVAVHVRADDSASFPVPNTAKGIRHVKFYVATNPSQLVTLGTPDKTLSSASGGLYKYSFTANTLGQHYIVAVAEDLAGATTYAVSTINIVEPEPISPGPVTGNDTRVNFNQYETYMIDYDGDGRRNDLYFHGIELFILLHGEIAIPIALPAPEGFVYTSEKANQYAEAFSLNHEESYLTACLANNTCEHIKGGRRVVGDLNKDGHDDIFIKSATQAGSSLVISGTRGASEPAILAEINATGHVREQKGSFSETPLWSGNLSATDVTLNNGYLVTPGQSFHYSAVRNPDNHLGANVAPNEGITQPPAGALAAPTIHPLLLAEMDSITAFGGSFRVNEMGGASYSVPLDMPQGTAGVAPTVSLEYSSQNGSGVAGLGWQLSAGGAISRCRQTLQIDNSAKPLTFTQADRFCFNGQRMLVQKGQSYGGLNTQYKTEIFDGNIIKAVNGVNGNPEYFIVYGKDGSSSIYGQAGAQRKGYTVNKTASPTMSWHLLQFKDSVGNGINYTYEATRDYFRLKAIAYGASRDVVVTFNYGTRKDSRPNWVGEYQFKDTSLLSSVVIKDGGRNYRSYHLQYNQGVYDSGDDQWDRLVEIKPCVGSYCTTPLKLSWGHASLGQKSESVASGRVRRRAAQLAQTFSPHSHTFIRDISSSDYQYVSHLEMDINGDGKPDIVTLKAGSGDSGWSIEQKVAGEERQQSNLARVYGDTRERLGSETPQLYPIDLNMDSRMDLVVYAPKYGTWRQYYSSYTTSNGWKLQHRGELLSGATLPDSVRFADVNADGLPDLLYTNGTYLKVHLKRKKPNSNTSASAYEFNPVAKSYAAAHFDLAKFAGAIDINADGNVDLLATSATLSTSGTTQWKRSGRMPKTRTNACSYSMSATLAVMNDSTPRFVKYPLISGSWSESDEDSRRYLPQCTKEEFRRRLVGPMLIDINHDGASDMVWAFSKPGVEFSKKSDRDPEYHIDQINYRLGSAKASGLTFGATKKIAISGEDLVNFQPIDVDLDGYTELGLNYREDRLGYLAWEDNALKNERNIWSKSSIEGRQTRLSDINGDGYLDKVVYQNHNLLVYHGGPNANNLITRFTTGLGIETFLRYSPLNLSGAYTQLGGIKDVAETYVVDNDCRASYPSNPSSDSYSPSEGYGRCMAANGTFSRIIGSTSEFYEEINHPFKHEENSTYVAADANIPAQEFISSAPVVTTVGSSAPIAGKPNALAVVQYGYEDLRIQAGGRGMLGFKKLHTTDFQTGVTTTTEYRQDWPYIGTPKATTVRTSTGQLLSKSVSKMGIYNITDSNVSTKRRQVASSGTQVLGSLVLYTRETVDSQYAVNSAHLRMPNHLYNNLPNPTKQVLSDIVTTTTVDSYNNIKTVQVSTYRGRHGNSRGLLKKQTTVNLYYPGTANTLAGAGQRLGRLKQTTVKTERGGQSLVRNAHFTYYGYAGAACAGAAFKGLLCSEKVTVSDTQNSQAPEAAYHYYDRFGNKTFVKTGSRYSKYTQYDSSGRYPLTTYGMVSELAGETSTAPSGYSAPSGASVVKLSEVATRSVHGVPLLSTTFVGDGSRIAHTQAVTPAGTPYFKSDSTGAWEQTAIFAFGGDCLSPELTAYWTFIKKAGGASVSTCHDKTGKVLTSTKTLVKDTAISYRYYDVLGRVTKASEPLFTGDDALYTETTYDILGRPLNVKHPFKVTDEQGNPQGNQLARTHFEYNNLSTTVRSSGVHSHGVNGGVLTTERVKTELKNEMGELIRVTEQANASRSIRYEYNVQGKLTKTIAPASPAIEIKYNGLGQKYEMIDPDKGTWQYEYNSYGDLIKQTDARDQVTTIQYDFAGRKLTSTTTGATHKPGAKSRDVQLTWTYDIAKYGLGQVAKVENTTEQYSQQFVYDTQGRVSTTVTTMPGAATVPGKAGALERFYQKQTYDEFGRPHQTFDAARVGPQFSYNGIQNHYNERGSLYKVTTAGANAKSFYEVIETDARGNVTRMQYGDGNTVVHHYDPATGYLESINRFNVFGDGNEIYTAKWDHLGNLRSRKDSAQGNLLETFKYDDYNRLVSNKIGTSQTTVTYFDNDNIKTKSDEQKGSQYSYTAAGPHAVTKIGTRTFAYDANGNATEDKQGAKVKRLVYTAKDQVQKIEVVAGTVRQHTSHFYYGTGSRFKRVDTDKNNKTTTTLYIGGVEKVVHHDGEVQYKRTVAGVAQVLHTAAATGALGKATYKFLHKDHLGSITAITNSSGVIEKRMAFDPWGARRKLNNPTSNSASWTLSAMQPASIIAEFAKTQKPVTNRGFTGHEMLDEVGIIHMNGRIYDASIGRFLQADPNVDGAKSVGGYNRYAYVKNNPLNATDPTGYFFKKLFKNKIFQAIAVATISYFTAGLASGWALAAYGSSCAVTCSLATASLVSGIAGGAAAGFAAGVAGTIMNGGGGKDALRNGLIGAVSGAAFGAIGGAFTKASGAFQRGGAGHIFAHGAAGGVSNVLQGGKFGHGFISAGFAKFSAVNWTSDIRGNSFSAIMGRTTISAMVGGTVSQATGGKFANGARTAALAHLVNAEADNIGRGVKGLIAQKGRNNSRLGFMQRMKKSLGMYSEVLNPKRIASDFWGDLYDHENFQRGGAMISLAAAVGTLTPCSLFCAAGSLVTDGVLALDSWLNKTDPNQVGLILLPAAAGASYEAGMKASGMAPGPAKLIGVGATLGYAGWIYHETNQ